MTVAEWEAANPKSTYIGGKSVYRNMPDGSYLAVSTDGKSILCHVVLPDEDHIHWMEAVVRLKRLTNEPFLMRYKDSEPFHRWCPPGDDIDCQPEDPD